jgi:signal transduction histidine kinase
VPVVGVQLCPVAGSVAAEQFSNQGGAEVQQSAGNDDEEVERRFLEHIHSEAVRMKRLSETLLRLARTGMDSREPELGPVDLGSAVREAARGVEPLVEGTDLSLAVETEGAGRVLADHAWLEQVLLILAHNAVQHSDEGGGISLSSGNGKGTRAEIRLPKEESDA